jgi:hypothetical protein
MENPPDASQKNRLHYVTTGFYSQLLVTAIELADNECILSTTDGLLPCSEAATLQTKIL